ncbi:hypothetical protein AGRA3207_007377 [Actinomadura graeca]|uniref:Uncharacterized protein n=1 Tax=Actinomadura graeca TaxID=2750812 RepID=A0ABX8R458_9ACTN|nr:hypothetical protein [Actinomadura graeca]QXJ25820.1 hypothetical protein AGRA3207_007377 [Actinomadura graeca]
MLTDWFVTSHLTGTDDGRELARAVLARAGEHHPPTWVLFEPVLEGEPVRRAHHAVYAALTSLRRRDLDHATALVDDSCTGGRTAFSAAHAAHPP